MTSARLAAVWPNLDELRSAMRMKLPGDQHPATGRSWLLLPCHTDDWRQTDHVLGLHALTQYPFPHHRLVVPRPLFCYQVHPYSRCSPTRDPNTRYCAGLSPAYQAPFSRLCGRPEWVGLGESARGLSLLFRQPAGTAAMVDRRHTDALTRTIQNVET